MRLLPNIRYGTERYPEKVARRLRALNITTWIAAVVASGFAIVQLLDPTHGFTNFDQLVERHRLEKIKTTGDAYMVVSGVPLPRPDHAQALAQLALQLRAAAKQLRDPHGRDVPIRIGISGPVVAGVVGTRKFFYDVWGKAVNVASRMESTGAVGKIQASHETYERLKNDFVLEECG